MITWGRADGLTTLRSEIWLGQPIERVFAFFADAGNLEELTPPWLRFRIVTPRPIVMRQGARLEYALRLRGVPVHWESEITVWDPPRRFADEQRRGPYRAWIHEHSFAPRDGGTDVGDFVRYAVPGGWLIDRLVVRRDVRAIFDHRTAQLRQLFG
ncbi:MAG TPA: SRPBCC family protein [Candidatus Polarisedimenticolaceae bacterium]|nr:SRPBCC family protein [Candidatus Polarisedimenticolaceae bacterium]